MGIYRNTLCFSVFWKYFLKNKSSQLNFSGQHKTIFFLPSLILEI